MQLKFMVKSVFIGFTFCLSLCTQAVYAFQVKMENKTGKTMLVSCATRICDVLKGTCQPAPAWATISVQPKQGPLQACDGYHYFTWNGSDNHDMWFKKFKTDNYDYQVKVDVSFVLDNQERFCRLTLNYDPYFSSRGYSKHEFSVSPKKTCTGDYVKYRPYVDSGQILVVRIDR